MKRWVQQNFHCILQFFSVYLRKHVLFYYYYYFFMLYMYKMFAIQPVSSTHPQNICLTVSFPPKHVPLTQTQNFVCNIYKNICPIYMFPFIIYVHVYFRLTVMLRILSAVTLCYCFCAAHQTLYVYVRLLTMCKI